MTRFMCSSCGASKEAKRSPKCCGQAMGEQSEEENE